MLFFFLLPIEALIRTIANNRPLVQFKQLAERTVVLMEITLMYRSNEFAPWQKLDPTTPIKSDLLITCSPDRDWTTMNKNPQFVAEYTGTGTKPTFFFTSQVNTMHRFALMLPTPNVGIYGAEMKLYEGRAKNPNVISQTDSTLRELERQIRYAIGACQEIENVLRMDLMDESEYDTIMSSTARLILGSILFKIVVVMVTFIYFNKKLKQFYVTKKIAMK